MFPITICNLHIMSAFALKRKMCIKTSPGGGDERGEAGKGGLKYITFSIPFSVLYLLTTKHPMCEHYYLAGNHLERPPVFARNFIAC